MLFINIFFVFFNPDTVHKLYIKIKLFCQVVFEILSVKLFLEIEKVNTIIIP